MTKRSRPNVLFLTSDQQRFDCLGVNSHGYVKTPNIDRLAAEGVNLTGCYVNNPVCMPSRATLLTGRYPHNHGVTSNGFTLPEQEITIANLLSHAGYRTGNLGKLHFLPHSNRNYDRPHPAYGFDVHVNADEPGSYPDDYIRWIRHVAPGMETTVGVPHPLSSEREGMLYMDFAGPEELSYSAWVADQTIDFIDGSGDTPWFAIAGFYLPHLPCNPLPKYLDHYPLETVPPPDVVPGELADKPEMVRQISQALLPAEEEVMQFRRYYYASCTMVDFHCGRIIDHLASTGQLDNTIVVYYSDHGDACGDNYTMGKHQAHYDSCLHVPMVWRWPEALPGNATVDGFFEAVDLVPTLLDGLGLEIPRQIDGDSLWPHLTNGGATARNTVLVEYFDPGNSAVHSGAPSTGRYRLGGSSVLTLISHDYKYWISHAGDEILYDRRADPGEHVNLAGMDSGQAALAEMRKALLLKLATTYDRTHQKLALY